MDDYWNDVFRHLGEWNRLASVHQLPREVLSMVFQSLVDDHIAKNPVWPYAWVSILSVCKYWYEIAMDSPRLWTFITIVDDECREILLERSRNAPLSFYIHLASSDDDESGLWYLDRTREYFSGTTSNVTRLCRYLTEDPYSAASLDALQLVSDGLSPSLTLPLAHQITFPVLSRLNVTGMSGELLASLSCPVLRHLELCTPGYRLPTQRLLELLVNLPLVETLTTSQSLHGPTATLERGAVTLPRLACLCIRELDEKPIVTLLEALVIPENAAVISSARTVSDDLMGMHIMSALQNNLSVRIRTDQPMHPTRYAQLYIDARDFVVRFLEKDTGLACPPGPPWEPIELPRRQFECYVEREFGMRLLPPSVLASLSSLLRAFGPLKELRALHIRVTKGQKLWKMAEAFKLMINLERLTLDVASNESVKDVLCGEEGAEDNVGPFFPRLSYLSVDIKAEIDVGEVCNIVQRRQEAPGITPLSGLHLCHWNGEDAELFERLQVLVPTFMHHPFRR